jgi:thiol:disulfide interchange protein
MTDMSGSHPSRRQFIAFAAAAALALPALAAEDPPTLPFEFDPARDPARDLELALRIARAAGRNVIVEVGGEWCSWCHILDRFFSANADIRRYRDAKFVWLKVNWSKENRNEAFLRHYPAIKEYPHLFVLDAGGKVLHSQNSEELETTRSYDPVAMRAFLVRWAPK